MTTLRPLPDDGGVSFGVKVVPGAVHDRIVGRYGELLKVQVAAPPEGGRANAALCALLAKALGVPVQAVAVQSGHGSPRKVVAVRGITLRTAALRLLAAAAK